MNKPFPENTLHLYVNMPEHTPCFPTVAAALESPDLHEGTEKEPDKSYPAPHSDLVPAVIHIGPGIYREKLVVSRPNLTFQGEGSDRQDTVLCWGDAALDEMPEGDRRGTFRTASVRIDTHDFTARHLTFRNDAGYGCDVGQALALYVDGDRICFEDCCLLGSQDTLFTAPLPLKEAIPGGFKGPGADRPRIQGRHYFRDCLIQGDVDFIFGGGISWFESCVLFSKMPENKRKKDHRASDPADGSPICGYITAASTPKDQPFGYVFRHCRLESDCPPGTVMLGRPWREWARTVYLNCELGAHIHPAGWADWDKPHGHFLYGEYCSTGPGASPDTQAAFSRQLTEAEAAEYTPEKVLAGWTPRSNPPQ